MLAHRTDRAVHSAIAWLRAEKELKRQPVLWRR